MVFGHAFSPGAKTRGCFCGASFTDAQRKLGDLLVVAMGPFILYGSPKAPVESTYMYISESHGQQHAV